MTQTGALPFPEKSATNSAAPEGWKAWLERTVSEPSTTRCTRQPAFEPRVHIHENPESKYLDVTLEFQQQDLTHNSLTNSTHSHLDIYTSFLDVLQ